MSVTVTARAKCPYCGRENQRHVETNIGTRRMVWVCDLEDGGCDRDFAVSLWLGPVKVRVSPIEWDGEE